MKGVSSFISYALTILFAFIILIFFTYAIYSYYDQAMRSNVKAGLKQITTQTTNSIVELYDLGKESDVSPSNSSSIIISDIDLNYPEKVSGKSFEVELVSTPGIWGMITDFTVDGKNATIRKESSSGAKIVAKTTQKPIISYEHDVPNIPIILQGKFRSGQNDTLRLIRYNYNESINDMIILGESDIIIGITNVH